RPHHSLIRSGGRIASPQPVRTGQAGARLEAGRRGEFGGYMRILVLGGDGYLGWPTAMHFSRRGDDVFVVDNFTRRACHIERGTDCLTTISPLMDRVAAWRQIGGREIGAEVMDITDFGRLRAVIADFAPDTIIHYGEIPSAPYSMI